METENKYNSISYQLRDKYDENKALLKSDCIQDIGPGDPNTTCYLQNKLDLEMGKK